MAQKKGQLARIVLLVAVVAPLAWGYYTFDHHGFKALFRPIESPFEWLIHQFETIKDPVLNKVLGFLIAVMLLIATLLGWCYALVVVALWGVVQFWLYLLSMWWHLATFSTGGAIVAAVIALPLVWVLWLNLKPKLANAGDNSVYMGARLFGPKKENAAVEDERLKDDEDKIEAQLVQIRAGIPGIRAVPHNRDKWGGWISEAVKRVEIRSQNKTNALILDNLRNVNEAYTLLLQQLDLRESVKRHPKEVETRDIRSSVDRVTAQAELVEAQVREAEAKAKLARLKNPLQPTPEKSWEEETGGRADTFADRRAYVLTKRDKEKQKDPENIEHCEHWDRWAEAQIERLREELE